MTPNTIPSILPVCDLFLLFGGVTVVLVVIVECFGLSVLGKYTGCKVFITK